MPTAAAAAVGIGTTLFSNSQSKKAAKRAGQAAQLQPFEASTPFGGGRIARGSLTIDPGAPGAGLAPGFESIASSLLGQAGGVQQQGLSLDPNQVFQAGLGRGAGTAGAFLGAGGNFLQGGQDLLASLGTFDPNQFAQDRFAQLEQLAGPGEQNVANQLANRLFSRGRIGAEDTAGGRAFGELSQALARARTERGILSQQAASQEFGQRIGQAGALSGIGSQLGLAGEQIATSDLGRFIQSLQGGAAAQATGQDFMNQLLGQAGAATGGIQQAFAPTRSAIQTLLAGSELNQGGAATAAQAISDQGRAQSSLIGNLGGSLIQGFLGGGST